VGTTVGIHLYRRHQNSKPATANLKPGQYLWATLVGFVVTVAVATLSATLILWLDLSRYLEPVSHGLVASQRMIAGIWSNLVFALRQLGDIHRDVHNDAMSSPKPPEQPTEERVGEMIGKINFLAVCAFFLWGYSTTFLAQLHLL
jgi:hypothetical protein